MVCVLEGTRDSKWNFKMWKKIMFYEYISGSKNKENFQFYWCGELNDAV